MTQAEHLALMCQIRASALRMAAQNAGSAEERADFQRMAEHWTRKADEVGRSLPAQ
jgi:hypothetical protein